MNNQSTLFSSSECITWFAARLTESVAIVTVNLLSIILFLKNSNLRTRSMYLVINLTVADMLVGVYYTTLLVNNICDIVNISLTWVEYSITKFAFYWFPITSLTKIAVISLDRMHATFRPFRHRIIKKWVYGVAISVVWVLAAAVSTAITMFNLFGKEQSHHEYLWQSYCCLCLFIIFVSYSSIVVKFRCEAHPQNHGAASRQRKLTVALFIMTVVSLLTWLPYVIATFIHYTTGSIQSLSYQKIFRLQNSLSAVYFSNSLVNPIVYTIRMPEFRKALLALFKGRQRQNAPVIPRHVR